MALNGADERLQLALGSCDPAGGDPAGGTPAGGPGCVSFLASQEWTVPGQAVRFLTSGIKQMLDGLGLSPGHIKRIACVIGPGSFTGLRMSLAAAEGLAAGSGALLAGLDHLALLAREATQTSAGAVLALSWSRRGQVYAQAFADQKPLSGPQVLILTELREFLAALPRPLCVLGGGLRRNLALFQELAAQEPGLTLLPQAWDAPRPETLLTLAAEAAFGPGPLTPVYLRPSDAEENLVAIAAGRGLSEAEARAILAQGSRTLS